eukprot:3084683-Rhodomonas_salina.1
MSQRLALPQYPRQPPRSLCSNPVVAQPQMSQRLALPQYPRECIRSSIPNLIVAPDRPAPCTPPTPPASTLAPSAPI